MRLTSTIPLALLAALTLTTVAPRAAQPRARSTTPLEHRAAHRHQAPVEPCLVARQQTHRLHVGTGGCGEPLCRAGRRIREAGPAHDGVPANVFWSADSSSILFFLGNSADDDGARRQRAEAEVRGLRRPEPEPVARRHADRVPRGRCAPARRRRAGGRGGRGRGAAAPVEPRRQPAGPPPPTEIRIRSLVTDADTLVATVTEPIATVSWINDTQLALSAGGGGGQTIRHEQTPDYSGAKIIYTITERSQGTPADTYVLPVSGGAPVKYTAGGGGGFGGRGGNRWIDATHFLDRSPDAGLQAPQHLRSGPSTGGEPRLVHEDVKDDVLEHDRRRARAARRRRPTASGSRSSAIATAGIISMSRRPAAARRSRSRKASSRRGVPRGRPTARASPSTRTRAESRHPPHRRRHADRRSGAGARCACRHRGARHRHRRAVVARRPDARLSALRSAELGGPLRRSTRRQPARRRSG